MGTAINSRALTIIGIKEAVRENKKIWFIAFNGSLFQYEFNISDDDLTGELTSDDGKFVRFIIIDYKSFKCNETITIHKEVTNMNFGEFYDKHAKTGHFFSDTLSFATYLKQRIVILEQRYPKNAAVLNTYYPEFLL